MRPIEIKRAGETYLKANWTRTPIHERNKGLDRPTDSFIILHFLPGASTSLEIKGAIDRVGVFVIQIFTPLNVGTDEGFSHGGRLEELFRNYTLGDIDFQADDQTPRTESIGKDEELQMYQHNTIIPFTVITG